MKVEIKKFVLAWCAAFTFFSILIVLPLLFHGGMPLTVWWLVAKPTFFLIHHDVDLIGVPTGILAGSAVLIYTTVVSFFTCFGRRLFDAGWEVLKT